MTEPGANSAAAAQRTLTITGGGTGSGTVTSTPAGINCVITAGVAAATGCKASFAHGTNVTLLRGAPPHELLHRVLRVLWRGADLHRADDHRSDHSGEDSCWVRSS